MLNIEDGSKANYFLGDEANTNEGNPNANIEEFLFGEYEEAAEEVSLNKKCDHDVMFSHAFLQKGYISPNWILLDTGLLIDFFSNPRLLTNIHKLAQSSSFIATWKWCT